MMAPKSKPEKAKKKKAYAFLPKLLFKPKA